jgi:hypothetical protein
MKIAGYFNVVAAFSAILVSANVFDVESLSIDIALKVEHRHSSTQMRLRVSPPIQCRLAGT